MSNTIPELQKDDFLYRLYPSLSKDTKAMVVVLHGYNGNIDQLHKSCVKIRDKLVNAVVIAPQAPLKLRKKDNNKPVTYSWINISDAVGIVKSYVSYALERRFEVTDKLEKFIARRTKDFGLEMSNVGLSGHSLGAIMGFVVASKTKLGSLVSMSSVVPACIDLKELAAKEVPIHYIIGDKDELFIGNNLVDKKYKLLENFRKSLGLSRDSTLERFNKSGISYSNTVIQNCGHRLSEPMLNANIKFLAEDLKLN